MKRRLRRWKKMLKNATALFFLSLSALAVSYLALGAFLHIQGGIYFSLNGINFSLRSGLERPQDNGPTVGGLVCSGKVAEDVWYWVDTTPMKAYRDVMSPAWPLWEGAKALLVSPERYLEGNFEAYNSWTAFAFKKIHGPDCDRIVISKKIYLSHWADKRDLADKLPAGLADSLEEGRHFFKEDAGGNLVKLSIDDVVFLRRYYRVWVGRDENGGRLVRVKLIRPIVGKYILYDYYPSGKMRHRTEIIERGLRSSSLPGQPRPDLSAEDRDKWLYYEVRDRKFNDKGTPQTTPHDEITTILKDNTHPYWLQNMLHD